MSCRVEPIYWVPCGMRLSQYWCVSKPFTRLLWGWYSWWYSWILIWVWTCLAPGVSARLWYLASYWPPVHCGHPTWIKNKIPLLGGISLASHTWCASFRIFSKVSTTSLWDISNFILMRQACCGSLYGLTYSPSSAWTQLSLLWGQRR